MGGTCVRHIFLVLAVAICTCASASGTTIYDIQYTADPSGDSPYDGQVVTTGGVVTAVHYAGFVMCEGAGPWQAVFVYTYTAGPAVGDQVELTGLVDEYGGMTEIKELTAFSILSHGNPVTPLLVPVADAGQEQYESVLIAVEDVTVTALLSYGEWTVDGVLVCDDINDYLYFPKIGDELASITGTLFYRYGAFELEPRFTADIAGDIIAHYALGGDVVTMNATRDVLIDHWVEVQGDQIVGIHAAPPPGIPAIASGGLIFPGLIDAHNHHQYNVLGPIPFGQLFEHRDEWRNHPIYDDFNAQYQDILNYTTAGVQRLNVRKLAEVRAMCNGTTTIQGANSYGSDDDPYARQGIGINNAHRWPPRIFHDTFPLSDSASQWQARASENWRRFVVHLAEGTNQTARNEFAQWQSMGMLDSRTAIIHGTALEEPEWSAMAAAGAHLIWSPQSNLTLYGTTADVPGALAAGINVALAPDWTESGANSVLDEMRIARDWSDAEWSGLLTPQTLTEMVTVNAAEALGMSDIRGAIVPGLRADLVVIPGDPGAPYAALLAAEASNVKLTVVGSRPGYGDPALMNEFDYLTLVEDVTIAGQPKRLALAVESHAIDHSDQLFSDVISTLEAAYEVAEPELCCFRGLEVSDCDQTSVPGSSTMLVSMGIHPNPCNPRTTVTFALLRDAQVSVELFTVGGRRVSVLASGYFEAGDHTLKWDGLDGSGHTLSSGVYLVRLNTGTTELTKKVVLVR